MTAPETPARYIERDPREHALELVSEMAELLVDAYTSDQSNGNIKKSLGNKSRGTHISFEPAKAEGDLLTVTFRESVGDNEQLFELTYNPDADQALIKRHPVTNEISIDQRDIPRITQARQILPLLIERDTA